MDPQRSERGFCNETEAPGTRLGFRVLGLGFWVWGLGFRVLGLGLSVSIGNPPFFKVLEAPVPLGSFESTANNSVSCFLPIILSSQFLFRNFALFF